MSTTRRDFLKNAGLYSIGFLGLQRLSLLAAEGSSVPSGKLAGASMRQAFGYGPLVSDPNRVFDLPEHFSYRVLARQGERMNDGFLRPGDPDGMAAFPTGDGRVALICNHELSEGESEKGPFGPDNALLDRHAAKVYDVGHVRNPQLGGTTTLIYNPATGRTELQYLSLVGTDRNCAGGPTPWNTWITCEETNLKADGKRAQDHGYNFEVPVSTEIRHFDPVPLKAMGRFRHEAVAVDPRTGIVYQTEDMGDGLIYRFIPNTPGKLADGGRLQALAILDEPSRDTRNWPEINAPEFTAQRFRAVRWIDIEDVESPEDNLRFQGFEKGAARFARGEGMWYGDGEIFFACTNGGAIRQGQVFRYRPSPHEGGSRESEAPGQLELFVESSSPDILKNCDNLTIAPNGHIILCEDAAKPCNLVGISPEGQFYMIGSNPYTGSELAGACFSPDGETLFLNLQGNGLTLAISGPWASVKV